MVINILVNNSIKNKIRITNIMLMIFLILRNVFGMLYIIQKYNNYLDEISTNPAMN